MRPVDMRRFAACEGDCLPACIATVTGISLSEIPHFCLHEAEWYPAFTEWLETRGYAPLSLSLDAEALEQHLAWARGPGRLAPWIAGGQTDRGRHFVVYVGAELFHDPNPHHGRQGLTTIQDATLLIRAAC